MKKYVCIVITGGNFCVRYKFYYSILEAFVTCSCPSSLSSLLDSELWRVEPAWKVGLLKLLSDNLILLEELWFCSHSGNDPDGLGASSTSSAVVATEGDLRFCSVELDRFKYFKVCSSLRKSMPGASQAATWGWFWRLPGTMSSHT